MPLRKDCPKILLLSPFVPIASHLSPWQQAFSFWMWLLGTGIHTFAFRRGWTTHGIFRFIWSIPELSWYFSDWHEACPRPGLVPDFWIATYISSLLSNSVPLPAYPRPVDQWQNSKQLALFFEFDTEEYINWKMTDGLLRCSKNHQWSLSHISILPRS